MAGRTPLIAILVVAALARFWAIGFCLPATMCRPDEEAVAGIATQFFERDFNPNFFDWPTLFMYAVAAGVVVFFKIGLWLHWFRGEYHFLQIVAAMWPAPDCSERQQTCPFVPVGATAYGRLEIDGLGRTC